LEHPHETLVRRFFAEFGNEATVSELFTEDAVWLEPGASPISGRYQGPAAIAALIRTVIESSDHTFHIVELVDVVVGPRHGMALVRVAGEHGGRSIVTTDTVILTFRDGRIAQFRVVSEDQREVDEFWA